MRIQGYNNTRIQAYKKPCYNNMRIQGYTNISIHKYSNTILQWDDNTRIQ